ncbi:MAG: carboxypeptidase regulatory-like domain-containing protein [Deltaproteobacteria bacterium]|nr:carboxypeptidase regulatory-like domain-containing protein [Deltaproteobacteria bacterium]
MRNLLFATVVSFFCLALVVCGGGGNEGECDLANPNCADGLVCEATQDGKAQCFSPLTIKGTVIDAIDDAPIEDALVQAVDVNGAAVGTSARTDSNGSFTLTVPATRDQEGSPVLDSYMLRAQAAGYQPFPTAIRPAIPLDASVAQGNNDDGWTIESTLTVIKLLPLPGNTNTLGSISGTVLAADSSGVLVIAEGSGRGRPGFTNSDGEYTIFNVPAGSYTVVGYKAGVQLETSDVTLTASENKTGVDLAESSNPLSTVNGTIQIVNAPGGLTTSVVLAVDSTFVEDAARGVVPPGLHASEIGSGAFTIEDVPDGEYVVLAAFENDQLVRDPDQTIGGTSIVRITVPDPVSGNTVNLPESFKITEALEIFSPGADGPELVTSATPVFSFANDTSEEGYEVHVFDAFGNEIWMTEIGPSSSSLDVQYAGPALEDGMYYQFKAHSWRVKLDLRTPISATEDLKGVFYYSSNP